MNSFLSSFWSQTKLNESWIKFLHKNNIEPKNWIWFGSLPTWFIARIMERIKFVNRGTTVEWTRFVTSVLSLTYWTQILWCRCYLGKCRWLHGLRDVGGQTGPKSGDNVHSGTGEEIVHDHDSDSAPKCPVGAVVLSQGNGKTVNLHLCRKHWCSLNRAFHPLGSKSPWNDHLEKTRQTHDVIIRTHGCHAFISPKV